MHATDVDNFEMAAAVDRRPRTVTVLSLLVVTALIFSYLGAYAVTGTLVSSGLMQPWPPGDDPRPRHMVTGFVTLMASFVFCATAFRVLSSRQLRRIDAIADEEH